jgi:hypothetical protein
MTRKLAAKRQSSANAIQALSTILFCVITLNI